MVNKIKLLGCLMILGGRIFAEEVKSDSLHWNTNLLKQQKLFFATGENWIPPTLPDDPTCLCAGCCLIPLTGCTAAGHHIWAKKDSTRQNTVESKQRKWGFGIGYATGVCFADDPLCKSTSDWTIDPFAVFARHLHWLNMVRGSIFYFLGENWVIETGLEYGGVKLTNREGLESVRMVNVVDSIDGCLATSSKWNLEKMSLFIAASRSTIFSYGAEFIYARATTNEAIWAPIVIEEREVKRECIGCGIFFSLKVTKNISKKIYIHPFLGGRISVAYEYRNNSPWKNNWQERLIVSFSGVYAGLQFVLGGSR